MKPKSLGELCAATSDLANQTGSFDHPQAELDILSFLKAYKWAMETRGPKSNSSELLFLVLITSNFRSKMNELAWRHHFPSISLWEMF